MDEGADGTRMKSKSPPSRKRRGKGGATGAREILSVTVTPFIQSPTSAKTGQKWGTHFFC